MIFGDAAPDAPELAYRGEYGVGVRTVDFVNEDIPNVLNVGEMTDRLLSTEIWYPAIIPPDTEELTKYTDSIIVEGFKFFSRSLRDAEPDFSAAPYPLIIMSHGLGGNKLQMTYLADNLASKGYIVVAIDHDDGPVGLFSLQTATAYRPMDIQFILDEVAAMNDTDSFLNSMIDAENTGLIGYSYGGYGALVSAGAGIREFIADHPIISPGGVSANYQEGHFTRDERIKAVFTFAPFGNDLQSLGLSEQSYWTDEALASIHVPLFIMVGSDDDVAQYRTGVFPLFEQTTGTNRHLLTILNARHNVAPNPSPPVDSAQEFLRYGEAAWRSDRLNNIAQHFVTVFFGIHLKQLDYAKYLDLIEVASEGNVLRGTEWEGFPTRTAIGMTYKYREVGE